MSATTSSFKTEHARKSILAWIQDGRFKPGEQMPSERALAEELGMNHQTVRRGLERLVRDGVIVKQPRVGNFVKHDHSARFGTALGLILPERLFHIESHAAPSQLLCGVNAVVDFERYSVQTLPYRRGRFWKDAGQLAVAKGLRGVLLTTSSELTNAEVRRLIDADLKVMLLSPHATLAASGAPWVRGDAIAPALRIFERLLELGHRQIAIAHYRKAHDWLEQEAALRALFAQRGLPDPQRLCIELPNEPGEFDLRPLTRLFERPRDALPSAIVVPDEVVANAVFQHCYRHDLRVPQDVSLAALNNYAPQLTPVPLASPESGALRVAVARTAAARLVAWLEGETLSERGVVMPAEVSWGESLAVPATHGARGTLSQATRTDKVTSEEGASSCAID